MKNFNGKDTKRFYFCKGRWRILAYFNNSIFSPKFSKETFAFISGTSPEISRTFPTPNRLCSIGSPTRKLDIGSGVNSASGTLGGNGRFRTASRVVGWDLRGRFLDSGLRPPLEMTEGSFRPSPPLSFRPSGARGEISRLAPKPPNRKPGWSSSSITRSVIKSSFRSGF